MAKDGKGVTDNCGVGAFESFGFGFLLDAAKLAIGVSVMVVQNKLKFVSAEGAPLTPCVYTFRIK